MILLLIVGAVFIWKLIRYKDKTTVIFEFLVKFSPEVYLDT